MADLQKHLDQFYFKNGPCCAGCDHWHAINSVVGECHRSAPVAGKERLGMIFGNCAPLRLSAGHPFTHRAHHCGDFKDDFDWASLPMRYRISVGDPTAKLETKG